MAVATQRDLEFVIKVRDRSREGFSAATVSVKQLTQASKAAGQEFNQLKAHTAELTTTVEKLKSVWSNTAGIISKMSLATGAAQMTQSYSHFGAAANGLTFALVNLAAKANVLPPKLNNALEKLNLFMNGSDKLRDSLKELSKSDNFWVRLFGDTALPLTQTAAIGTLTAGVRALAGVENRLAGGGVIFGPAVGYLEGMERMFKGRLTEGVRKATDNFWGFGRALQWAATVMEIAKHPMTRLIVVVGGLATAMASLNTAVNLDRATYRLMTVANVPVAFLRRVQQEIQRMGVQVGIGATELTGAFERITGAGFQGAEAFDVLRAAAMGARFGMGTVVQTQDILTSIMSVYSDEVEGAQDALGLLLTAIREGKADADQFGASFGRVFGQARQAGLTLTELLSAVTVLSRTGLPAAEGVAAVRQAIGDLSAPSRQATRILYDLGISAQAVEQSLGERGLVTTARELLDVLSTASWVDPSSGLTLSGSQLIYRVFDQAEGRNAILQWYDSLREATDEVMQRVAETPPELARTVWRDMQASVSLSLDRFKALLENFQAAIGGLLTGPLSGFMNFITNNLQTIGGVLVWLLQSVVLQLLDLFLASRFVEGALVFITRLVGGLKIFGLQLKTVFDAVGALAGRVKTMFMQPLNIGAIIQSLRNVVFSFQQATLQISGFAGRMREHMRMALINPGMAMAMASRNIAAAGRAIGGALATGINAGFKAVKFGLIWLVSNIMDAIWIIMIFGESWNAPFKVMGETVKLASLMDGTFRALFRVMGDFWAEGKTAVIEWFNANKHYIDEAISAIGQFFTALAPAFNVLGNQIEGTFRALPALIGAVISGIQMLWNIIMEVVDLIVNLGRVAVIISDKIGKVFSAIGRVISQIFETIGRWLTDYIANMWKSLGDMLAGGVDGLGMPKLAQEIRDFFAGISDNAATAAENIVRGFQWAGTFISAMLEETSIKLAADGIRMFPEGLREGQINSYGRGIFGEDLVGERRREALRRAVNTGNPGLVDAETSAWNAMLGSGGRERQRGNLGRGSDLAVALREAFDFNSVGREFNEMVAAGARVPGAYATAFTNDQANAVRRSSSGGQSAARGFGQIWVDEVLAAERRRREADAYVTGSGNSNPRTPVDLSAVLDDETITAGGGGRDPYGDTVARLREAYDETYRTAKANDMANAAKSAGLELQWQAVELGRSELLTSRELAQVAEIRGLVEAQDVRNRELRIEDYRTGTEELRRQLDITRRISDPVERQAELAALQAEMALRRERRDITEDEISAARTAARDNARLSHSEELVSGTANIREEIAAIQRSMSVRYMNARQYAVDTAVMSERNRMLALGIELTNADAQARLAAAASLAEAQYTQQTSSLGFLDTIRQRAGETLNQIGNIQTAVADGAMRLGEGIADSLFNAAAAGRASFGEMTAGILSDIARMITRMLVMKAIQSVLGFSDGGIPGVSGGEELKFVPGFAKGGAFTNSIVSSPTLFKFASGGKVRTGLMGEAGDEAIMPLTRLQNGKLGVGVDGMMGGQNTSVFAPQVTINIENSGGGEMDAQQAQNLAKLVSDTMDKKYVEFQQRQNRSNNRLVSSRG